MPNFHSAQIQLQGALQMSVERNIEELELQGNCLADELN
jgi:hypothetical protein